MSTLQHPLAEESKVFLTKHMSKLPNTIYYGDWNKRNIEPNTITIESIQEVLAGKAKKDLRIAEIGIGMGATSYHIAKFLGNEGELHLFDFSESSNRVKDFLNEEGFSNIYIHSSSFKKLDSYNWALLSLLQNNSESVFDYVFLDGAHSFPVDALAFFLVDLLLKPGGFIDFDDYDWTHAGHLAAFSDKYTQPTPESSFGTFKDWIHEAFTEEQIQMQQVAMILEHIVLRTGKYAEIIKNKLYQKKW